MHFKDLKTKFQRWFSPKFEKFREALWTPRGQVIFLISDVVVTALVLLTVQALKPEKPRQYELVRVVYPPPAPISTQPAKVKYVKPIIQEKPTHVFQYLD